jgi:hypothetical protein
MTALEVLDDALRESQRLVDLSRRASKMFDEFGREVGETLVASFAELKAFVQTAKVDGDGADGRVVAAVAAMQKGGPGLVAGFAKIANAIEKLLDVAAPLLKDAKKVAASVPQVS